MWLFKHKSSLESASVLKGFTDWHSHILPGVDDGIPDMKSALQVLERYEHFGNCKVAVFDRPWNKDAILPSDNYIRVKNWDQIVSLL